MKNLYTLFTIIVATVGICTAQTPLDPPNISSQNAMLLANDTTYSDTINFDDTSLFQKEQNEFMFGHQWFNALSGVNKRLYMNCYNTNEGQLLSDFALNFYRFPRTYMGTSYISYDIRGSEIGNCYSFQIDPEAPVTELDQEFVPTSGDSSGAIYGFGHKEGAFTGLGIYDNRYIYPADSGTAGTGRLILSKPIGYEIMRRHPFSTNVQDNGSRWYLSINLRRTDAIWNDSTDTSDIVLTIKIPIRYRFTDIAKRNSVIVFDSISSSNNGLLDKGYYQRGGWMEQHLSPAHDSIFVVRRSMLPKYGDSADITLSAYFTTKLSSFDTTTTNPPFRLNVNPNVGEIDSMNMEVRFYGKCNIAIDWIRLETPETRALFRGEKDSAIAGVISKAITKMKQFRDTTNGMPNARIWRFYITDEPNPLMVASSRYYSSLLEGRCITEAGGDGRYHHAVPLQPTYWGNTPRYDQYTRAPYIKYVVPGFGSIDTVYKMHRDHTLGYKAGWQYIWEAIPSSGMDSTLIKDLRDRNFMTSLCDGNWDGSAYEKCTYVGKGGESNPCGNDTIWASSYYNGFKYWVTPDVAYARILGDPGHLGIYEYNLNGMTKWAKAMLFSSKPWLANIWIASEWFGIIKSDPTIKPALVTGYSRAQTGEEIRLYCWNSLIFGAKGLMYDNFDCELGDTGKLPDTSQTHTTGSTWLRMGAMGRYEGLSDSFLKDDDNGEFLLKSDKSGSDFIIRGDSSHIDQYISFDSSAYALGVDPNRIYLGRKSVRLEVMKVHDRVKAISDTLMRLQLQGWYAKGHRSYITVRDNDTTYLTKYLKPDLLETRPCIREEVEGWDSTFCDVTIHKDTSVSMDDVFYIGVLNRRTNPLIRLTDTTDLQFYSTAEFDSLTALPDPAWTARRYKQGGSRELSLPFNYQDSNGRYALLHVQELGGGVDTVIGQDSRVLIKLLPGEGKMLKVKILRSNEVAGELGFSNQNKICVYPKMSHTTGKWVETDTLVHYMTYHKRIHGNSNGLTGIYFRKSKPANKYMNDAAIQWENTEYLLTYSVYHNNAAFVDCDTCAYPSIVTRFDSVSQEYRSFVVYGCVSAFRSNPLIPANYQYIVESVVRVRNDSVIGDYQGKALTAAPKRSLADWGTPMVCAADTGNFYCWADADAGIMVGWKKADTGQLVSVNNIHWATGCNPYTAQHPSMNSYSRYMRGQNDNEAALVWQENKTCGAGYPQVFYTRLWIDNGQIRKKLSYAFTSGVAIDSMLLNADSTILMVSSLGNQSGYTNSFPVVYRDLKPPILDTNICDFETHYSGFKLSANLTDKVFWQTDNMLAAAIGKIRSRLIWIFDTIIGTQKVPHHALIQTTNSTWNSSGNFFDQPVVSGGEDAHITFDDKIYNCLNFDMRAVNVNFRSRPVTYAGFVPTIVDTLAVIYDFPQPLYDDDPTSTVVLVDEGKLSYPHVATRGSVDSNDWQRNHRIYNRRENHEATPPPPPTIRSSGQYYFKSANKRPTARQFFGFGDDSLSFGISEIVIGEKSYPLKRNPSETLLDYMKAPDTLSTEWFNVDNIETMDVVTTGISPDRVSVWLERESDGATWEVSLSGGEEMRITREAVELTNGDDENYRVRLCSNNQSPYYPETAIGDEESNYGKANTKSYRQINLGNNDPTQTVFIYPNPARDEVNITIKGTERSEIIIVSAVGGEQIRFFTDGSKAVNVNTSLFPSGMYVVRVRRSEVNDIVVPFIVFR